MGMAVAQQLGAAGPGAPPPPPAAAAWHVVENGASIGPFTPTQIAEAAASGRLRPDTLVWTSGMAGWTPAARVPQLAALFGAAPPPIPRA
jgi:hypothetical protein